MGPISRRKSLSASSLTTARCGATRGDIHRFLEQNGGSPWRLAEISVRRYHNDQSSNAGELGGICRRLPSDDGESRFLDVGRHPAGQRPYPAVAFRPVSKAKAELDVELIYLPQSEF